MMPHLCDHTPVGESTGSDLLATAADPHSAAADRYIEQVLQVWEAIERGDKLDPEPTHSRLKGLLRDATATVDDVDAWQTTLYALAAWTDELLLETPLSGREWWHGRVLEVEFFGTRVCSERFFQLAQHVAKTPGHASLRIFYLCVLLGFRGVYAHGNPAEFGLPATLPEWMQATRTRLAARQALPLPVALERRLRGAEPVDLRRRIVWWAIAATSLLAANVTLYSLTR